MHILNKYQDTNQRSEAGRRTRKENKEKMKEDQEEDYVRKSSVTRCHYHLNARSELLTI